MKQSGVALATAIGLGCLALPVLSFAMGGGGMGGGGGTGGGMGGNSGAEPQQYDPAVEYQHGTAALDAGKYRDAISDFQHVIDVAPRTASAWLMLGMSKAGVGDDRGAEHAYERAVKLDDTMIQAHRQLALSLIKLKQNDKAQAELAALQSMSAKCADACPDAGDLKTAIAAIQAAMTPATQAPSAANDAVDHLSLATPEAGNGAYVRAVSLINEHRWDDALASLHQAEAVFGPHPDILTYEGYVWRHKGDWARAEGYYRQVLALAPNHRGATEYYGELKVLEGDQAGARAMLARLDSLCTFGCAEAEELRSWIAHGGDPAA